jgi:addiction module RelE/StbE family toxin
MDKKVIWMPQTYEDLESIFNFIYRDSPNYASSFVEEIIKSGETLHSLYNRGRIVPEKNSLLVREIFVKEFRLIYTINEKEIHIITVIHGRRDLRKLLKKIKF